MADLGLELMVVLLVYSNTWPKGLAAYCTLYGTFGALYRHFFRLAPNQ